MTQVKMSLAQKFTRLSALFSSTRRWRCSTLFVFPDPHHSLHYGTLCRLNSQVFAMCFLHCDLVKILLHQLLDFHILEKHVERYCVLVKRRERVDNEKTLYNIVKDIIHVFTSKMSLKSLSEKNGNLMGGQQFKSALFLHGFQAVTLHLQSTLSLPTFLLLGPQLWLCFTVLLV